MQDQRIEKLVAFAVNITKLLVIIYLGLVEVFKISKLLRDKLDTELDISRKWASQNYSILKKRLAKQKIGEFKNYCYKLTRILTTSAKSIIAERHKLFLYSCESI